MNRKCTILIRHGDEILQFYRDTKGQPSITGEELNRALKEEANIIYYLRSNPDYIEESYITVHGDIDYIYKIYKGSPAIDTMVVEGRSSSKWAYSLPKE